MAIMFLPPPLVPTQLEHVLLRDGNVVFSQCTGEVAHFSLRWWADPSSLKHKLNPEGKVNSLHTQRLISLNAFGILNALSEMMMVKSKK